MLPVPIGINRVICGDCLEEMAKLPVACVDTIITDPPYGLGFMGKEWDHGSPGVLFWREALRVVKPGAIMLVFGGTRTFHRLTCAVEDAGWEIRDCMMWLYSSGFPKSHDISKAIDKAAGAEREIIGSYKVPNIKGDAYGTMNEKQGGSYENIEQKITVPATDLAQLWNGYGTALKPAWEPIIVAMKPLDGTFAANAEKHGVAGLWIDGGRIPAQQGERFGGGGLNSPHRGFMANTDKTYQKGMGFRNDADKGRWPANLILDEEAAEMLGQSSRFFYCPKSSKQERGKNNTHPTVKPLALMEYLCKLTKTPTGGVVLDPFGGSGTTALACLKTGRKYILIEKEREYVEIARQRIKVLKESQAA